MADAFSHEDARGLLKSKRVLFLGDSNIRAQYKDLVWLLNSNTLVQHRSLRRKLELSYLGDTLIHRSKLNHGRDFQEVREYIDHKSRTSVSFMFISRCYNRHVEELLNAYENRTKPIPDVIVMNSCLWDLCRWGPNGVPNYKDNMVKLMRKMALSLPKECLVIWTTALPVAPYVRGALLLKQIECMEPLLRFEVMEANMFARDVVVSHGYDVLDNHYYARMQMHRRAKDGVHYMPVPVRFMTNLILTHLSLSWDRQLPMNITSKLLDKAITLESQQMIETAPMKAPAKGIFSRIGLQSPVVPRKKGLKITFNTHADDTLRTCHISQEDYLMGQGTSQEYDFTQMYKEELQTPAGPERPKKKRRRERRNKRVQPYSDGHYYYRY